nr:CKLF-like MARVEL transmembrane domain-containing protein 7 isoform X2 [Macaca fascicularis]
MRGARRHLKRQVNPLDSITLKSLYTETSSSRSLPAASLGPQVGTPTSSRLSIQVTLLIAFICVRSSPWTNYSAYSYFEVVTICDLIMILAFYLVHLFRFYRVLTCISWPLSELLHYLIGTLLLLIASIVAASKSYNQSGLVAGAIFGFMATFLCMASVWLSYKISCVTQSTDWVLPCCPGWRSGAIRAHCSLCLPASSDPSTAAS